GNREEADREALLGTFNRYFRTNRLNYARDYIEYTGSEHSIYQMKDNVRGYLRMISGMSWANNPFNMLRILSSVVALAFATGAFSMMFSTMWNLSSVFPAWRLFAVSLLALTGMLSWVIFSPDLCEPKPQEPKPHFLRLFNGPTVIISHDLLETKAHEPMPHFLRLYNGATVMTLLISLTFYFIVLYMMFLTAGLVLLPPDYILQNIGAKEVGIWFYLELAWFATSL